MARLEIITEVRAEPLKCFDLSRDLDLHKRSFQHTKERAIAGRVSGLIELGQEVTWRAKHFGVFHTHTSRITGFESPRYFRDEMTKGRFKNFVHDHFFEPTQAGTRMTDLVEFQSPWGFLGKVVDRLVLARYIGKLIQARNQFIRLEAENPDVDKRHLRFDDGPRK
jgi:ligand-binding SRPBCC domain-containing protein